MKLYHVTEATELARIRQSGMRPRSCWASDIGLAEYYRDVVLDEGGEPVLLVLELAAVDEAALSPDYPGIEEPITRAIGKREAEVHREWRESAQDWRASLEIVQSLKVDVAIPPELLKVTTFEALAAAMDGEDEPGTGCDAPPTGFGRP